MQIVWGYDFFKENFIIPSAPVPGINNDESLMYRRYSIINEQVSEKITFSLSDGGLACCEGGYSP